jgi:hypothetical protein
MSLDIFDPQKHKIVAIVADGPEKGQHLHVSLLELAMDMSKVDFAPFFDRMRALEQAAVSNAPPAPVDLTPIADRLSALERRPAQEIQGSFDAAPLLQEIGALTQRLADLEREKSAADARHIEQERMVQTVIQAAAALLDRIEKAEGRLDQHKDVINGNGSVLSGLQAAIEAVGGDAEKKRAAAA